MRHEKPIGNFDIYFYKNDYRSTSPQKLIKKMKPLRSLFPCGEVSVFLPEEEFPDVFPDVLTIYACMYSSDDIMTLTLITNILRQRYKAVKINLFMPYLPYGRQDRICAIGEAFSLQAFASLINMLLYDTVITDDVHNEYVAKQLISNLVCLKPFDTIKNIVFTDSNDARKKLLVYPDKGAYERYGSPYNLIHSRSVDWTVVDKARKNGDIKLIFGEYAYPTRGTTEKVISTRQYDMIIVVDDICDGGKTFTELYKSMKDNKQFDNITNFVLYTTHGFYTSYSQFEDLKKMYNGGIFCKYNHFNRDNVTELKGEF